MGKASPLVIGRHSHPAVRPEAAPPPTPSGIDYLALITRRHTEELARGVNYAKLAEAETPAPAPAPGDPPGPEEAPPWVQPELPVEMHGPVGATPADDAKDNDAEAVVGVISALRSHYGFTNMPFTKNLAPQMLHRYPGHAEAVARIGWCVDEAAIGVITGEVGSGKTVAVRAALADLDTSRHTLIYLGNPAVGARGLYCAIVARLGGLPRYQRSALIAQTPRRSPPRWPSEASGSCSWSTRASS